MAVLRSNPPRRPPLPAPALCPLISLYKRSTTAFLPTAGPVAALSRVGSSTTTVAHRSIHRVSKFNCKSQS